MLRPQKSTNRLASPKGGFLKALSVALLFASCSGCVKPITQNHLSDNSKDVSQAEKGSAATKSVSQNDLAKKQPSKSSIDFSSINFGLFVTLVFGSAGSLVWWLTFIEQKGEHRLRGTQPAEIHAEFSDVSTLANQVSRLVETASQANEHAPTTADEKLQLELRLAEAEGALRYYSDVVRPIYEPAKR